MIGVFFLIFYCIKSVPVVNIPLENVFVGKYDGFEKDIDPDTFESSDGFSTTMHMKRNDWIKSTYYSQSVKNMYESFSPFATFVDGDYAYVFDKKFGLWIVYISLLEPFLLGGVQTVFNNEIVRGGITVKNDIAYVSANGFKLIDVSNVYEPTVISTALEEMLCANSFVDGNYAYVACFLNGLQIVDISNPSDPQRVGSYLEDGEVKEWLIDVVVDGNYAYAPFSIRTRVIDVSNKAFPSLHDTVGDLMESQRDRTIVKYDRYLFITCGSQGIFVEDAVNPGGVTISIPGYKYDLTTVSSDHVFFRNGYIFVSDGLYDWVCIISIMSLPGPLDVESCISTSPSNPTSSFVVPAGNFLFASCGDQGMEIADISDKGSPIGPIGYNFGLEVGASTTSLVYFEGYLFARDVTDERTLGVFSILADGSPQLLSVYPDSVGKLAVRRVGGDLLLYHKTYLGVCLAVINATDPYSLTPINSYSPVTDYLTNYFFVGDFMYFVWYYGGDTEGGLRILECQNAEDIILIADYSLPYPFQVEDSIFVHEGYVYLASEELGFRIVDVQNISEIELVSVTETPGLATDVFVVGDIAYLAESQVGLQIYDVTDRHKPVLISNFYSPEALKIFVQNDIAYLSCQQYGLSIIDVSVVDQPFLITRIPAYDATSVYVKDNLVFLGDGSAGFKIIEQRLLLFSSSEFNSYFSGDTTVSVVSVDMTGENEQSFTVNREDLCENGGIRSSGFQCHCKDGYAGELCETWSCGFDYNSPETCSGHGECKKPNKCKCPRGYSGDLCETNQMYATVMAPVLGTTGFFSIGVCLLCCLICCIAIATMSCLFFVCVNLLSCFVCVQRWRLKKFAKLENIDVLLQEQQLENDTSIAQLSIDESLFEIDMKEIHLIKIIGAGGSNSTVYRSTWKDQLVAFKCFKTRMVCSSQDDFEEFQRELIVFGSISHPNIVRFFGACLAPPRVGILMEYCEKGDLEFFLKQHSIETDGLKYDFFEKMRMVREITSSMGYLHSRNIIHRDLKPQNVLVDSKEQCKLMDFGLSKIVTRHSQEKTRAIGTSFYMSPEIVNSGKYDEKCDVYSFAILLFILLTEEFNPYGEDSYRIEMRVANDENLRPDISFVDRESSIRKTHKKFLKELILTCWKENPSERYSFEEINKLLDKQQGNGNHSNNSPFRRKMNKVENPFDILAQRTENESIIENTTEELENQMSEMKESYERKLKETERKYEKKIFLLEEKVKKLESRPSSQEQGEKRKKPSPSRKVPPPLKSREENAGHVIRSNDEEPLRNVLFTKKGVLPPPIPKRNSQPNPPPIPRRSSGKNEPGISRFPPPVPNRQSSGPPPIPRRNNY